jgi:hypothetical protein
MMPARIAATTQTRNAAEISESRPSPMLSNPGKNSTELATKARVASSMLSL